jgi:putative oxidoreductase
MPNKILSYYPLNTDMASLLLRLIFGALFIRFGYMKLVSFDDILPMFPNPIGIGTKLSLILVIFAELFCGLMVTIGFLTRLTVIPIFITMTVVFFIVHAKDAFDSKTLPLVFWILSIVIFVLGSGKFSADRILFKQGTAYGKN